MAVWQELSENARKVMRDMSVTQRLSIVMAGLTVAVALGMLILVGSYTEERGRVPLALTVEPQDYESVETLLMERGIQSKYDRQSRTVTVPLEARDQAYMLLASQDMFGPQSYMGFERMIQQVDYGTTEPNRRAMMRVAKQNELARMIGSLEMVKNAKVIFAGGDRKHLGPPMPPRASVLVETSFGKDISQDVADSIIRLVSASMAGLQQDNVQLTDQKGRHYYARDAENASFLAVQRQEHERRVEEEMRQKVEALVRSYYPGTEAYGFVNVVLDMDQREKQTRTVLEGMPLRTRSHKIEQETTEAPPAEVGTIPNVAGAPNTAGGATSHSTYAEKMSETTNENSYEEMQEVFAPGAVEDLSVSVVMHLPSRPVREPETGEFVLDEQTGEPQRQAAPELGEDELVGLQMAIAEAVNHQQWREIQVKQVPWEPAYEPRLERDWALVLARFAAENIGLLLLTGVAVACLVMIWTQVRRVIPAEEMLGLEEEVEPETSPFEQVSDQDRANEEFEQMRNRVSDLVNEDPKKAASLVRRWLVME